MGDDIQKKFQQWITGAFLIGVLILVFGQNIRSGLAQLSQPTDSNDPADVGTQPSQTQVPTQTNTPAPTQPVIFQVQAVPQSFKPTAIPPGNNVAAPLNSGPESQSKAGALSVGSFNAGAINSGAVSVSGDLNLGGVLNIQGLIFGAKAINAGEDSYYGDICVGYDYVAWSGRLVPWGVENFKVNTFETCDDSFIGDYTCKPSESRDCVDVYVNNQSCITNQFGPATNRTNGYGKRNISCKVTRILTQQ